MRVDQGLHLKTPGRPCELAPRVCEESKDNSIKIVSAIAIVKLELLVHFHKVLDQISECF